MHTGTLHLIEFECSGQRIALPLDRVRRVVASAEPSPLPGSGELVLGLLNVAGEIVTIVDFGRRLGLPPQPIVPEQQILIVELSGFLAGVVVDRTLGVGERDLAVTLPAELGAAPFVAGVVRLDDGLCLVIDPEQFLFGDERDMLARALEGAADGRH